MVVNDEIRAKGLGVLLEGSILQEDTENLEYREVARYYRARFSSCREGLQFSVALNVVFVLWIVWLVWRW